MKAYFISLLSFMIFSVILIIPSKGAFGEFSNNETRIDVYGWFSSIRCFNGTSSYALLSPDLLAINAEFSKRHINDLVMGKIIDGSVIDGNTGNLREVTFVEIIDDKTQLGWSIYLDRVIRIRVRYFDALTSENITYFEGLITQKGKELNYVISTALNNLYCYELLDKTKIKTVASETAIPTKFLTKQLIKDESDRSFVVIYKINYLFIYTNESNFENILNYNESLVDPDTVNVINKNMTLPFRKIRDINNTQTTIEENITFPLLEIKKNDFINSIYVINLNNSFYSNVFRGYSDRMGTDVSWSLSLNDKLDDLSKLKNEINQNILGILRTNISEINLETEREKQFNLTSKFLELTTTKSEAEKSLALSNFYNKRLTIKYNLEYPNIIGRQDLSIPFTTDFNNFLTEADFLPEMFENMENAVLFFEASFNEFESVLDSLSEDLKLYDSTLQSVETQKQIKSTETTLTTSIIALAIAFISFVTLFGFAVWESRQAKRFQQANFLVQMISSELRTKRDYISVLEEYGKKLKRYKKRQVSKSDFESWKNRALLFLNFYEGFAYLINKQLINEVDAYNLWSEIIKDIYKNFTPLVEEGKFKELKVLINNWKLKYNW